MAINQIIIFVFAFLVLAFSSRILVRSLTNIARFLGISDYAVSFILMGFATSIPELFVAINSGLSGSSQLSFGNVVGANILNITLLLGVIALVARGIPTHDKSVKTDAWIIWAIAMLPLLMVLDGNLERFEGIILIFVYLWYLTRLARQQKVLGRAINRLSPKFLSAKWILKEVFLFFVGIILLLWASGFIVSGAEVLTKVLNLKLTIFGIFIVALGTTIPELSFGIRSILLKHEQMTIGNAIGSVAVNSTLVLGLLALISPFSVELSFNLKFSMVVLFTALWLFNVFLTQERPLISRKEGFVLLAVYFVFLFVSWLSI